MMMRRLMLCLPLVCLVSSLLFVLYTPHIQSTPLLSALLEDMKLYKLDSEGDTYLHGGDLYEHSIWTHNAMVELLDGDLPYVKNLYLTQREKEVLAVTALLHDIGKAGRKEVFDGTHARLRYDIIKKNGLVERVDYYQDYQEHPRICFEYAAKPLLTQANNKYTLRDYHIINKNTGTTSPFDIALLYKELGITHEEQKIVALLLGIHYEFGNLKHNKITPEQFLAMLEDMAQAVDYHHGVLDEKIVRLAILIQVADVKGLMPVAATSTRLFPQGLACEQVHKPTKFSDPFKAFSYVAEDGGCCCGAQAPMGVNVMEALLDYFHARQQQPCSASVVPA